MQKLIIFVMVAAVLGGCRGPQQPTELLTVKLAVNDLYCMDTACACVHYVAARTYPETLQQLKDEFGVDLQLTYYVEPYNLEYAIVAGEYDGAICKPWTALMLQEKAGTVFERVVDIPDPDNNQWLTGIVVVMADSEIQSLEELSGKSILFGQADAYEKHQAAKRLFQQKGIEPGKVDTMASCIENLGQLMDGKVDAVVVSDYALSADCAVDFANPEDFRIIGTTERIPLTSLLIDIDRMPKEDRARLQAALLAFSAAGAPDSMLSKGFAEPVKWNPPELEK